MKEWVFGDLSPLAYEVIVADPPWGFELYSEEGEDKSAQAQYDTMTLQEIADLPVGYLAAKNTVLLLWICEWMKPGDHQWLLDRWGFTYKSSIIWPKMTVNGKFRMGTGYRVRSMHERIIVATIGNPKHKAFPSIIPGLAREHSRKPDEFYEAVLKATPNAMKRLDLFSRENRPGFDHWGNQTGLFDAGSPESIKQDRAKRKKLGTAQEPVAEPTPLLNLFG